MRHETVELDGPLDFELGLTSRPPLTYTVTWPDELPARGLAILIGGCGVEGETTGWASRRAREYVVEQCGMAAVMVDYHCNQTRPSNGGALTLDDREHMMLIGMAVRVGAQVEDLSVDGLIAALGRTGQGLSALGIVTPGRGERQNFGILQALDHLAVLGHLLEHEPPFDPRQVYVAGSSHGGYIGHLMAKLAPGVLAGVADNSGYVQPPMNYLGLQGMAEHTEALDGFDVHCRVESAWSFNRLDPNFYDRNRDLIRDVGFIPHLNVMRAAAPRASTVFSMVVCAGDHVVPPADKIRQADLLSARGFPTRLKIVEEHEIDGVVFKAYEHALGASFRRLAAQELQWLAQAGARGSGQWEGSVEYDCIDVKYRFRRTAHAPYVRGLVVQRDLNAVMAAV